MAGIGAQLHIYCVPETPMKNITLAIDDEIFDKVRIVAARKRTTVNAMVRNFLSEVAGRDEKQAEARKELLQPDGNLKGPDGADWKFDREETHER